MALYTILFGISIFLIALVMTIIKKMYFHWKKEHKIERMSITTVDRPAVSVMISTEKCLLRRQRYAHEVDVYDVISKSEISLSKNAQDSTAAVQSSSPSNNVAQVNQIK